MCCELLGPRREEGGGTDHRSRLVTNEHLLRSTLHCAFFELEDWKLTGEVGEGAKWSAGVGVPWAQKKGNVPADASAASQEEQITHKGGGSQAPTRWAMQSLVNMLILGKHPLPAPGSSQL